MNTFPASIARVSRASTQAAAMRFEVLRVVRRFFRETAFMGVPSEKWSLVSARESLIRRYERDVENDRL
jgi:hypothetical protein